MSSSETDDSMLDRYLDGLMAPEEAAGFLKTIDSDSLEKAKNLQRQIDDSLKRIVSFEKLDEGEIARQFVGTRVDDGANSRVRNTTNVLNQPWIQIAVAAVFLLVASLGVWFNFGNNMIEPDFTARALTSIYSEKVESGFKPYYYCEDDVRFAETFQTRLGQALALAEMPSNNEMIGISYLGGISRETTAMLCKVDDQNVLVFVDRAGKPGFETATIDTDDDGLNVFVDEKDGLVFCEVTPLDSAQMIRHFRFKD